MDQDKNQEVKAVHDIPFNIVEECGMRRDTLKAQAQILLDFKNTVVEMKKVPEGADKGEMIANITLAYRHIEDCIMRIGKVLQAHNGGKSIYDK